MTVYSRRNLRQRLGVDLLRDTYVGTNTASLGAGFGSAYFIDANLANTDFSGQTQYSRVWAKHNGMVLRSASFNFGSGAFISAQSNNTTVVNGGEWELHELISPNDKDRAIDWAIDRIWMRQEVAFPSGDGLTFYSLGYEIGQVFDWWVNANPTGSAGRDQRRFVAEGPDIRLTGSGRELRLSSSLQGSQQIVLDAEVRLTLGTQDTATINLLSPHHEHAVLYAAEAQCWEMLSKRAPAQDRRAYLQNAQRAAAAYSRLSARFSPQRDFAPRFRSAGRV
jgi:hypothetical protein